MRTLLLSLILSCAANDPKTLSGKRGESEKPELTIDKWLVIGDSISKGYMVNLPNSVYPPIANCRHSRIIKDNIDEWLIGISDIDVATFNSGMHDISTLNTPDHLEPFILLEEYKENLKYIGERLLVASKRVYFLTSTIVPVNEPNRSNTRIIEYNEAAKEVMVELGIPFIDMHKFSTGIQEHMEHSDQKNDVHYTKKGYELLAKRIKDGINE